jgi:glycerol-3-phosphate dehydrogenase subunit B
MINYDVVIIGGGIAGHTAGIRCLQHGLKVALVSYGQSALHFSSGSIDLLAKLPSGQHVDFPLIAIEELSTASNHPYSKVGRSVVEDSLIWFAAQLTEQGLPMSHQADMSNHQRITPLGTLKSTWLSQPYIHQFKHSFPYQRIVVASLADYRDFHPQLLIDNLRQHDAFTDVTIDSIQIPITLPTSSIPHSNEKRSIDFARLLKQPEQWQQLCDSLSRNASSKDLVIMPAIMGNGDGLKLMNRLHEETGLHIHELPTMPPSLLGIRIEEALSQRFLALGGVLLKGDKVVNGKFNHQKLTHIHTKNLGDIAIKADHFVLATGSYFSRGIQAEQDKIIEPIFNLDITAANQRAQWRNETLLSGQSGQAQPFISFGVLTDSQLRPSIKQHTVNNLYCCGSILADYDPIQEGSGGGVAIATAYHTANQIIANHNVKHSNVECVV